MLSMYLPSAPNSVWKSVTARNSTNEATATTNTVIKVRWKGTSKLGTDAEGMTIQASAEGLCFEPVKLGDTLTYQDRTWPVIGSEIAEDLDGVAMYRRVLI